MHMEDGILVLTVKRCPAITHMRENGYTIADHFCEHTRIVNEAVCTTADTRPALTMTSPPAPVCSGSGRNSAMISCTATEGLTPQKQSTVNTFESSIPVFGVSVPPFPYVTKGTIR